MSTGDINNPTRAIHELVNNTIVVNHAVLSTEHDVWYLKFIMFFIRVGSIYK